MMSHKKLILGSASPRRQEILAQAGFSFSVMTAEVEESIDDSLGLEGLCQLNAQRKAESVYDQINGEEFIVIGSDTVVWLEGKSYGKPKSMEQAKEMLSDLSGKTHLVGTGVSIISTETVETYCEVAEVTFLPLSADVITSYLERVPVLDKAGAYAIQSEGKMIIKEFTGEFECIMGLPIIKLSQKLIEIRAKNG